MVKTWRLTVLAISVGLALSGCGGGGGGGYTNNNGGGSSYTRSNVPYYTPNSGGTYTPLAGNTTRSVIQDIFTQDLNRDSVQEVVVGGRMSQPATQAEWQDFNMQIYGWNTGSFRKETSTWFAGTDNQIRGTEPAVRFGDFNGDGHIDMFVAHSTDMNYYGNGAVFFNTGSSSFTRTNINLGNIWSHDAAVVDLNGDGFADLVATDYNGRMAVSFGAANRTFSTYTAAGGASGSSVSVADYLGNGSKTIVLTDTTATGNQDTKLFSWSVASGQLVLTEVAALPASRFYLPKWNAVRTASGREPHEIRNINMDFNRDGRPDVVVISTMPAAAGSSHGYSEVQFLRNDGGGAFTDVTDTILSGYNTSTYASYQPVLIDVNKDGLLDIFLSAGDSTGSYDSSRALLATSDGKYVESYGSVLKDFYTQTQNMTSGAMANTGQTINIAAGPNGDLYLLSAVNWNDNGTLKTTMYASRIGSSGTTSAQATLDTISRVWPYLTGVQANEVLAQTAEFNLNGVAVIDWLAAMNPVGGLGISLDGRTGQRRPITGSISVPGLNSDVLKNVSAVDGLGRHFQVNLQSMSTQPGFMPANYSMISEDYTQNWSSRFIDDNRRDTETMSMSGDGNDRFATSVTSRYLGYDSPWLYRVGAARIPGSPWFGFSGVFGTVHQSTIFDFTVTRTWQDGYYAQIGTMQTVTSFTPGLVNNITPLWAGYAVAGWQDKDVSLYYGLQPTIFSGSMDLRLPTSVDAQGIMHYTNKTVDIRNNAVTFLGAERRWRMREHRFKLSGVLNDQGRYQARATYAYNF